MKTEQEDYRGNAIAAMDEILTEKNAVALEMIPDPRFESSVVPVLSVPQGREIQSVKQYLDEFLDRPERRRGMSTLVTQESFITAVLRFMGGSSIIFADPNPKAPSLLAIFDYHEKGTTEEVDDGEVAAGWCQHKAKLALRMSKEWEAWYGIHEKQLDQASFAAFIADHVQDCVLVDDAAEAELPVRELRELLQARLGGPNALMKLGRGLEVNLGVQVKNMLTLETGEIKVAYVETQSSEGGAPITTPNLFYITIPVFYGGGAYRIPVRLRYRMAGSDVRWSFHLYRPDLTFEHAFAELIEKVREKTELPVVLGSPEAA